MSIESKTHLIGDLQKRFSDRLTASLMDDVISIITDELTYYDVDRIADDYSSHDDFLDAYLDALAVAGRSPKTVERYRYIITRMLDSVRLPSAKITVFDLRGYLGREKARGIKESTLDGIRQIFGAYYGWLHREGLIRIDPTGNLIAIKCKKVVKDIFSDVDMEKLKRSCTCLRDKAIVAFLSSTGCRIHEVTQMDSAAVDLMHLECKVLGKGNKERIVYLDAVAGMALREYLASRTDESEALFVGKGARRLQPGGVRAMLKNLSEMSGVQHVHPHKFRRTLATNLSRRGMPIEQVAAILGHEKIDTTMQYVVLDKTDVQNTYRKFA